MARIPTDEDRPDDPATEVVRIARDLIRMDTSNHGPGRAEGEAEATDYCRALLEEAGLPCQVFEAAKGRTNLVARWPGREPGLPALMVHGHLDVVPADPRDWSVDPFGAEIRDGMIWGRGAVDMKGTDAMILASVREAVRRGEQPRRDIVLALFADEESGCAYGSGWMVDEHPHLFEGVGNAVSEVGGYSVDIAGRRAYLLQTGEKGALWARLTAEGTAGHGSQLHDDNAVVRLAEAVARIGRAAWPVTLTDTTDELLERVRLLAGLPAGTDPRRIAEAAGFGARFIRPSLQNVVNVTMFDGGYKANVVPERASAVLDVRCLPGHHDAVLDRIRELAGPGVRLDVETDLPALENPFDGDLVARITETLRHHDPGAEVLPYLLPAGTDNKPLSRLGIRGFGFAPLRLPADLDFPALFHGVDERVPLDSLVFGREVMTDLLLTY
ncbi:M20/M25/M40 family metallo-hydrolase [Kitasatospora sp. NPDC008115]|uniref:M20/M25/M40 family metallo-hydrolase n=1 Tax=Kitasatospora sp. NPDC008115 TaxID=3364022 RepID=UPI0036ED3EA6